MEHRSLKKKHVSISLLEEFNSKVYASLSSDSSSGDESAGEQSDVAPAPGRTRSVASTLGWMERLPPLQLGYCSLYYMNLMACIHIFLTFRFTVEEVVQYCMSLGFWGFCGIDVLFDSEGRAYLVDINPDVTGSYPALSLAATLP